MADLDRARAAWLLACDLAARAVGADVRVVLQSRGTAGRGSDATTTLARKQACYLAQVTADVAAGLLADASGLDRTTIWRHTEWIEDERDRSPAFDRQMEELSETLFQMAARVVLARLGVADPAEASDHG